MKDPVTGQVKTETITVNGPISLAETTTSSAGERSGKHDIVVRVIDKIDLWQL